MARYAYTIPRNTKGEGRILLIFTKKSFICTIVFTAIGLIVGYFPIGYLMEHPFIGVAVTLVFSVIGFLISTLKMPYSNNFDIFRKTGGENIDEVFARYIRFKKQHNRIYIYHKGGDDNE